MCTMSKHEQTLKIFNLVAWSCWLLCKVIWIQLSLSMFMLILCAKLHESDWLPTKWYKMKGSCNASHPDNKHSCIFLPIFYLISCNNCSSYPVYVRIKSWSVYIQATDSLCPITYKHKLIPWIFTSLNYIVLETVVL